MHLAELNMGRLVALSDDPLVKDFMDNLDRINGLGKRMPGFVWMMEGSGEPGRGNVDNAVGDDPLLVTNISVWEDIPSFERFVWGTVHKQFYDRKAEWFEVLGVQHFVMWWVPEGYRPSQQEALERLEHLNRHGDSDHAFGWTYAKEAQMWKNHACTAAE
ncbi:MAG: DUF3291 domain-containing protein [Aliishimia sp.]